MSGFSVIIRKLFTMKILFWSHLVSTLFGSITSANRFLLPSAVKGKSRRFMDSKKSLMFKIMEDIKEEGPIRCFHYVIDSDSHVITHMIPERRSERLNRSSIPDLRPQGPPHPNSELPVPLKIVDYRKIRLNFFKSQLRVLIIYILQLQ